MTIDRNDEPMSHADLALAALLHRADPAARGLEVPEHIAVAVLDAAAMPLARLRRAERASLADLLAGWVRVALPLAAAAAIVASVFLTRIESRVLADADLQESDPGALLSALDADNSTGLAQYLVGSDAETAGGVVPDSR
jgi:hypothetical protein